MHRKLAIVMLCVGVLAFAGAAQASPVYIGLVAADFNSLLGSGAVPASAALVTTYSHGNLSAQIVSQAFTDGAGNYIYLYQISNNGPSNAESLTRFTASPFTDAESTITLGYLTANAPAGFSAGSQAPLYGDIDALSGPTVGFNFPVGMPFPYNIPDCVISPGEISRVLYAESTTGPGFVTGNLIDGGVMSGPVVGPVPEPATMGLLALGGLAMITRRRRR